MPIMGITRTRTTRRATGTPLFSAMPLFTESTYTQIAIMMSGIKKSKQIAPIISPGWAIGIRLVFL
jgi:hypothetical protein